LPVTPLSGAASTAPTTPFQWALLGIGLLLLLLILATALFVPRPTRYQYFVFRTTLALAASCIVASIPWFFGGPEGPAQIAGVAVGAAGFFLIVFLVDPTKRLRREEGRAVKPALALKAPPQSIFISYRHADNQDIVGHLYDRLVERFGGEAVFRDVKSLLAGLDFRVGLESVLERCIVVLAVIGPEWEHVLTDDKIRRLDDPADFIVIEIGVALKRDIPIIPLLVHRQSLPPPAAFPAALEELRFRTALPLRSGSDFDPDLERLIAAIEALLVRYSRQQRPPAAGWPSASDRPHAEPERV
jgi:hypothetical protein